MLRCTVRTTVTLDDGLYAQVKVRAAESGMTVGSVLEEAVRQYLVSAEQAGVFDLPPLPTFDSGGTLPGIDLDDMSSVHEVLDEGLGVDALR
jgi:plasmid stability protein